MRFSRVSRKSLVLLLHVIPAKRGKVHPADMLQEKATKLLPLFACARIKQDPINRGHGAQFSHCPPPPGVKTKHMNCATLTGSTQVQFSLTAKHVCRAPLSTAGSWDSTGGRAIGNKPGANLCSGSEGSLTDIPGRLPGQSRPSGSACHRRRPTPQPADLRSGSFPFLGSESPNIIPACSSAIALY